VKGSIKDRRGLDAWYEFDFIIELFELRLSNSYNQDMMDLYLNALKYAIDFEHNSLQI